MEWLATINQQGTITYIETNNIKDIQLLQPINFQDKNEQFYVILIFYNNDTREQTVISHNSWETWQEYKGVKNENK